ncbi:TPA_asm: UL41 uORF 1 [Human alphaherpesvirus 1]|nr:TPA_asm: UL41 uORF 1 [Human alphaherpesvirus 1]
MHRETGSGVPDRRTNHALVRPIRSYN